MPADGVEDRKVGLGLTRFEVAEEVEHLVQDVGRSRIGAVDLVDDHDDWEAELEALAQDEAGLGEGPFGRIDQEQRAVGHEKSALDLSASPEDILRAVVRARLRSICRGDRPDWHFRILAHELAQPTPALRQLIDKVGRPLANRLLQLIGRMMGLPANDEKTHLCAVSIMGQIIVYVFADPLLKGAWPELKLTPEQVERIADHIADFSLSYIQNFCSKTSARGIQPTTRAIKPRGKK